MTIEFEDKTGEMVSLRDIEDALNTITALMAKPVLLLSMPPEFGVNAGNIRRCLQEHLAIRRALEARKTPGVP